MYCEDLTYRIVCGHLNQGSKISLEVSLDPSYKKTLELSNLEKQGPCLIQNR